MHGKMFVPKIKGYHTEIIGDSDGNPHQIMVKDTIAKAKAFVVTCSAKVGGEVFPEVEFKIDGPDATSRANAVLVASNKYRYVMDLKSNVQVNCRVQEIKAKIGATA